MYLHRAIALFVPTLALGPSLACNANPPKPDEPQPACEADPPSANAVLKVGVYDGLVVLPDGRTLTPAGVRTELGGFPADVALATTASGRLVALVTNAARSTRTLVVVDVATGALVSETSRADAFPGLAVAGQRIYASGGHSDRVDVYDLEDDGSLTVVESLEVGAYPTGLQLSGDHTVLYVALFQDQAVVAIDLEAGVQLRKFDLEFDPYGLALSPDGKTLWATGFGDQRVASIDVETGESESVTVGGNPAGVVVGADGTAWVAVSNEDVIVALDGTTHAENGRVDLREWAISSEGDMLPGTSPSALALSEDGATLYVTRAGDNAIGVIDTGTMSVRGNIPTDWYPTGIAIQGQTLVVSNGKGLGSGPNPDGMGASDHMIGTTNIIEFDPSQLSEWTAQVAENIAHPAALAAFGDCVGTFPIPREAGDATPIEHVILLVRENKTYDSLLGDLDLPDADRDDSLTQWPEYYTPNIHSIARTFANHDNFYANSESSVQGHLWLTSSFVSEYMERAWIEDYHGVSTFADDSATAVGRPSFGTLFTHLIHHGVDIRNYGEIVGALDSVDGVSVLSKTDLDYPGTFFNTSVPDEEKAAYAAEQLFTKGDFPPFVYILLPNDHGGGPYNDEVMVADNDYGTGLFLDALSKSPYWKNTVVFIVEDDPQSAVDHVDAHRSILMVVSPWAKRAHTSHVLASYPSVFKTIEQILGVPPMNRYDAMATPLYDSFTSVPDYAVYDALPRNFDNNGAPLGPIPPPPPRHDVDPRVTRLANEARKCLDLSGPDRNPFLLDIQYADRFGRLPDASMLWETTDCAALHRRSGGDGDGDGDDDAYDEAWDQFIAWQDANPGKADFVDRPARPEWKNAAEMKSDDE